MMQVGPGVKELSEGDVVLPTVPLLGTFTQAGVVKAKQLVRVGKVAALDTNTAAPTQQPQGVRTGLSPFIQASGSHCTV
jgi:NADPH:quinone reductase-like Zn-dependent oxidoreductase